MALFNKKKEDLPSPPSLESTDLPEAPLPPHLENTPPPPHIGSHSDFPELPETPDELPEFPGKKEYTYEPELPPVNPDIPSTPAVDVMPEDMDQMVEQQADSISKPEIVPLGGEEFDEAVGEEVQKIEEDEFEVEQDMLDSLKETRCLDFSKPLFVLVDNYKCVLEELSETKNVLKNSEDILFRVNELKNEMDKKYELWRTEMEDVQRKLVFVDKTLFEGGMRG